MGASQSAQLTITSHISISRTEMSGQDIERCIKCLLIGAKWQTIDNRQKTVTP